MYVATAATLNLQGWKTIEGSTFHYTDRNRTRMRVLTRTLKAGESVTVPQRNWTGTLVLIPTLK